MKSSVGKRSIVVAGHKTGVSLEEAFWNGLKEISGLRDMTSSELVGEISGNRQQGNLSSDSSVRSRPLQEPRCGYRIGFKAIPGCPRPFVVAVMRVTPLRYPPFAMQYRLKD